MGSDRAAVLAAYDELDAAVDKVLGLSFDALTAQEKLALQDRMEHNLRRLPTVEQRLIAALVVEADPKALGGKNWADVMVTRLRISPTEANRRLKHADLLGPRTAMTGESLEPKLPNVAAAQQRGQIGVEHVQVLSRFFKQLPGYVDAQTQELAEADLARAAVGLGPVELREAADRLAFLLNPDGDEPEEAEHARAPLSDHRKAGRRWVE
jgi:Domain of unknown function (DUF222)